MASFFLLRDFRDFRVNRKALKGGRAGVTGNSSCEKIEKEFHISSSSQQEGKHDHCTTNGKDITAGV